MPDSRPMRIGLLLAMVTCAQPLHGQRSFPYELRGGSDAAWLGATLLLGATAEGMTRAGDPPTTEDFFQHGDIPWFDRYATRHASGTWRQRSDDLRWIAYGSAVSAVALPSLASELRHDYLDNTVTTLVMAIEAMGLTAGATGVLKELVGRHRPYAYNEDLDEAQRRAIAGGNPRDVFRSFPSGHTSTTFAAAVFASTVVSDVLPDRPVIRYSVWIGSLSAATLTGWGRIEGGKHFPSDVVVGAALGSAIGYLVPRAHRRDDERATEGTEGSERLSMSVTPMPGGRIHLGVSIPLGHGDR